MERNYKITILKPCNEKWDEMTPKDNGRYCMNCSKTVVDFSIMSSEEIQLFFIQNQNKKICGRFKTDQLESLIIQIPSRVLYTQPSYHKMFLLALFIVMGTTLFSCQDKDGKKQKIDKVEVVDSSYSHKDKATGGGMAVKKIDCKQNPAPTLGLSKKDSQKDPKIAYSTMMTGEIATVDADDNKHKEPIDYDALFNTAYLDVTPFPEGGMNTFYSFIRDNYNIPKTTEENIRKVYVSFVIEKDGTLSTIKIIGDAAPIKGEEVIRVLKLSPKWTPGKLNNRVVRSTFTLPISFKQ